MALVPLDVITQLLACSHPAEAIPLLDEWLKTDQSCLPALRLIGPCLMQLGRREEAIEALQISCLLDPNPFDQLVILSDLLREVESLEDSLQAADAAISVEPTRPEGYASRSFTLTTLQRYHEALESAQLCLEHDSSLARGWYVLALARLYLGELNTALEAYDTALQLKPGWPLARLERALVLFQLGEFALGVNDYEARWDVEEAPPKRHSQLSRWAGEPVGEPVLLYGEQGLGDEIFFLGLLSIIQERQQSLVLELDERLVPLATRSFPQLLVLPKDSPQLQSNCPRHVLPLASLLGVLVSWGRPVPAKFSQYLVVPDALLPMEDHDPGQPNGRTFRIGLFWRSLRPKLGGAKSVELLDLAPLAYLPGVDLVSLQYGAGNDELATFQAATGRRLALPPFDPFHEIDRLAGLIAGCDAIVTIPGVPAHLGGALGVPTYVISPRVRGRLWYWAGVHKPTPWYPSVKVFTEESDTGDGNPLLGLLDILQQQVESSYFDAPTCGS